MSATKPLQLQLGAVELGQTNEEASESALGTEKGFGLVPLSMGPHPAHRSHWRPTRQPVLPGCKPWPPAPPRATLGQNGDPRRMGPHS